MMLPILPFSIPVFLIATIVWALFSLIYFVIAASVIYHMRVFTLPGHAGGYIMSTIFIAASCVLWLAGLVFLLQIPR